MHNRFDQLGKEIGLSALGSSGLTVAHDEISPDAHHADLRHEPDPARSAERARVGVLGQMASILCLIEIYSGPPGEDETLACLGKLIAFRQRRRREASKRARNRRQQAETFVRPFVWIITAGRPTAVLAALGAIPAPGWPPGVYFSPGELLDAAGRTRADGLDSAGGLLRAGIVVASELPRDRSTILVRLMAGGPALPDAIEDLSALPKDAHEHAVASQILLALRGALGQKFNRTTEEQEFMESLQSIGEKLVEKIRQEARKEARKEARNEGREEGREEGRKAGREEGRKVGLEEGGRDHARATLRRVLSMRQLAPSRKDQARIDRCDDLGTLDRWIDQALTARSVAEALR